MSLYPILLLAGVVADAWLAAYGVLRLRRTLAKLAFVALLVDFVVMTSAFAGIELGALGPGWAPVALWSFVLSHPLAALFLLLAIHGEDLLRRHPYVLLLLAPAPVLAWLAPPAGYDLGNAYATAPLNWYLVLCLALPLGEAVAVWLRTVARKSEMFALLTGAVVLVLTGPVYGFELQAVGLAEGAGSNPGTPVAAALFALALTFANPLRVREVPRGTSRDGTFPPGHVLLADEARPKGTSHFVSRAVAAGRPTLEVVRGVPGIKPPATGSRALAAIVPSRWPASVVLATASEFLARHRGGLVYLRDLAYLATLEGLAAAKDVLLALRRTAAGTQASVVASLSLFTPAERRELLALPGVTAVRLPDPAPEFEAILAASLGGGASQLLRSFSTRAHRRVEDLTYEDLPAIQGFLGTALRELARAPGDEPVITGWRKTLDRVNLELDRFARKSLQETAAGPWPSEARAGASGELVVKASDYWKGRELDEVLRVVTQNADRERFGERVRTAFVQAFGRAGDHIFESELKRLGKTPGDLAPRDVARLADASDVAIESLGSALDLPAGRADLEERGKKLRSLLTMIAEEVDGGGA
jgi:hypothetical protein